MEYVKLGKSDLRVSRICMGCMGFGNAATGQHNWTVDEEATRSIIKRGLDNLSGVMAQNTPAARATEQVWIKNGKYRK